MQEISNLIIWAAEAPDLILYGVLFLCAAVEYILPFLPGDMLVLCVSVLAISAGHTFFSISIVIISGSVLGAWMAFEAGGWLTAWRANTGAKWIARPRTLERLNEIEEMFRKHGDLALLFNRFLPGIRALFLVAAGLFGRRRGTVLVFAAVSAVMWNSLILAVGYLIGPNLPELIALMSRYVQGVWTLILLICVIGYLLKKRLSPLS
jgi:membrane protein DedA with SNARE-associated domain